MSSQPIPTRFLRIREASAAHALQSPVPDSAYVWSPARFREAIAKAQLSQSALARLLELPQKTVQAWTIDGNRGPRLGDAIEICRWLGVRLADLVEAVAA